MPAVAGIDGRFAEPTWLRVTRLDLHSQPTCRFVHFSDLHYKGDAGYATNVAGTINALAPEFVCFTGDLVEDAALRRPPSTSSGKLRGPSWMPWQLGLQQRRDFKEYKKAFGATGGAWLVDRSVVLKKHNLELIGMGLRGVHVLRQSKAAHRILLIHYPIQADRLDGRRYDLILAGHSHGGQVRLPFYGAPVLPYGVGRYERGRYDSLGGPLYVNVGIGTYMFPVRFNCRPEITVVQI